MTRGLSIGLISLRSLGEIMASLEDIAMMIGKLDANVDRLRQDFSDEKDASHRNRAVVHRRLDEQAGWIAEMKTSMALLTQDVADLRKAQDDQHAAIMPSVADWKRMKALGLTFATLLAIGGISFGSFLVWAGDAAVQTVRTWLRIN